MNYNITPFALVYDAFLSSVTDDFYMEMTVLDTYRVLEELLMKAISKFEFPRVNLFDYELYDIDDEVEYCGASSDYAETVAIIYHGGHFNCLLSQDEINILATYMVVEWLGQQLASIENTRLKYSASDFKFTSQANHMQKILQLKKEYEREGFHLQRLYKRREVDKQGIMRPTMHKLMEIYDAPYYTDATAAVSNKLSYCDINVEGHINDEGELILNIIHQDNSAY